MKNNPKDVSKNTKDVSKIPKDVSNNHKDVSNNHKDVSKNPNETSECLNSPSSTIINNCCLRCCNRNVNRAANTNNLDLMKSCIESNNEISSLNMQWSSGMINASPLDMAIKKNNKDFILMVYKEIIRPTKTRRCILHPIINQHQGQSIGYNMLGNSPLFIENPADGKKLTHDAFMKKVMSNCTDSFIIDYIRSVSVENSNTDIIYFYISKAVASGNLKLAAKAITKAYINLKYGFNELHYQVLNHPTPDFVCNNKYYPNQPSQVNDSITPVHIACINPDVRYLKRIVEIGGDVNYIDFCKRKPIHYAAACEGDGPLNYLIELGVELNELDIEKMTPLMIACRYNRHKNVIALLKQGVSVQVNLKQMYMTALDHAVKNGHVETTEVLLVQSVFHVDYFNDEQMTPLMIASAYGHIDLVQFLLSKGANIHQGDQYRQTPIMLAIRSGQTDIVRLLLSKGADYQTGDSSGNTPLQFACAYGWNEIVDLLTQAGAKVNQENVLHYTPVEMALIKNHFRVVEQLLTQGKCNVNCKFYNKMHIIHYVINNLNDSINPLKTMEFILKTMKADVHSKDANNETCLHYLAKYTFEQYMKNKSFDSFYGDMTEEEWMALHKTQYDSIIISIMDMIIGASHNIMELIQNNEENVLHIAFKSKNLSFLERLLATNFHLDFTSASTGNTLLHIISWYVFEGEEEWKMIKCLLNKINNSNIQFKVLANKENNDHYTPLELLIRHYSIGINNFKNNYNIIRTLQHKNQSNPNQLPMRLTCNEKTLEAMNIEIKSFLSMVKLFILIGCNPYYLSTNHKPSMLMHLMSYPTHELLDCFIDDRKQDLNYLDSNGQNVLFYLINNLEDYDRKFEEPSLAIEILQRFISKGININQVDSNGDTPFLLVSQQWNVDIMTYLYNNNADINHYNNKELNALRIQIQEESLSNVKTLIERFHVNINKPNKKLRTPMHYFFNDETNRHFNIKDYILTLKPQINLQDVLGRTPLHYLFVKMDNEFNKSTIDPLYSLTSLLQYPGINKEVVDCYDNTPLHYAVQNGSILSVVSLIDQGVDMNKLNKEKNSPLAYSLIFKHPDITLMLLQKQAKMDSNAYPLLNRQDASLIKPQSISEDDTTSPMDLNNDQMSSVFSIEEEYHTMFEDHKDKQNGLSLFRLCLKRDYKDVALYFTTSGFDIYQAIDETFKEDKVNIAYQLLQYSSNRRKTDEKDNRVNIYGQNFFHIFAKTLQWHCDYNLICPKLLSQGINLGHQDSYGNTPLHYASQLHAYSLCKWIITNNPSSEPLAIPNKNGCTPLIMSFLHKDMPSKPLIDLLWNKKGISSLFIDETYGNKYKTTLLVHYIRKALKNYNEKEHIAMIQEFIKKAGSSINEKDSEGVNSLMYCLMENNLGLFDYLIKLCKGSIDMNAVDNNGQSIIHYCIFALTGNLSYKNLDLLQNLFSLGFNPNIKDKDGFTPCDYAIKQSSRHVLLIFKRKKLITNTLFSKLIYDSTDEMDNLPQDFFIIKPSLTQYRSDSYPVFKDYKIGYWSVFFIADSPGDSSLSFYIIQLLQDLRNGGFIVTHEYGKIGQKSNHKALHFHDIQDAKNDFSQAFQDKTGNKWDNNNSFVTVKNKYCILPTECSLHLTHNELLKPFDSAACYKFWSEDDAMAEVLIDIFKAGTYSSFMRENRLPMYNLYDPKGDQKSESFTKKVIDVMLTSQYLIDEINPFARMAQFAQIEVLDHDDKEFKLMLKYINVTKTNGNISNIYRLNRNNEDENMKQWKNTPNHVYLFHGTKAFNLLGIISGGLKIAPPEAPVSGYRYGKGIYFADMYSRSIPFCPPIHSSESKRQRSYIFICEVVLGNSYVSPMNSVYTAQMLKDNGYHSITSLSYNKPNPKDNVMSDDGVIVPLGKYISSSNKNDNQKPIIYNGANVNSGIPSSYEPVLEFIVFDTSQVRLKYLVQVDY